MQRTGATQQNRRPILHEKGAFWMTATPIRDLMAEATSPLEYRMPEEYLHAIKKKKKKKSNNQYRLPFYNISEVVPIIKVAKVTNNLRYDQLK